MKKLEKKLEQFGSKPGLERIKILMDKLGNPQNYLRVILVGGTNGKGSTTSLISSILSKAGFKTGSFYSPHLISYNERFQINGEQISDKTLKEYEQEMLDLIDKGIEITMFEAITAIAYQYFAEEQCDFVVMEVGMGGEFDATNIAKAEIAIITNVSLDHTKHLGESVEEIARTKAGILKNATMAISGATNSALAEIEKIAKVKALGRDFFIEPKEVNSTNTVFSYLGKNHYSDLELSLLGRHQIDNAALSVAVAEALGIGEQELRAGLLDAKNPGRIEVLSRSPLIIADAAHNPEGIGSLITTLPLFNYDNLIVVFGAQERKDWREMVNLLGLHADLIIVNKPPGEAADPDTVARFAKESINAITVPDVKKSLDMAKRIAKKKDLILVCGSIYMLGELLKG
jgi:dihydrofolate synthase/folylpolyglutamate synthase